jgi:DNA topoisomerase-1
MNDQNIGNITLEETLNLFYYKNLGNYKEEVEVSNGRYGPYIRHGAAFLYKRNPLDVDFDRAKN